MLAQYNDRDREDKRDPYSSYALPHNAEGSMITPSYCFWHDDRMPHKNSAFTLHCTVSSNFLQYLTVIIETLIFYSNPFFLLFYSLCLWQLQGSCFFQLTIKIIKNFKLDIQFQVRKFMTIQYTMYFLKFLILFVIFLFLTI